VWWNHGHRLNTAAPLNESSTRPQTNNRAEIEAATVAVAQARANGITRLNVKTDSQFLISCVTQWMKAWKKNGWRTGSNEPVKNREELEALDRQLRATESELVVRWTHVRGHAGIVGNEMADQLARKGALEC
jgi:ribonuclease HI